MTVPTVLEANRAALEARYPHLAAEVAEVDSTVRLFPSRAGVLTGEVIGNGGPVLLHSRYDPLREAKREADALLEGGRVVGILLGMGLGHTVREVVEERRDRFFDLLVVERDPRIFRAALEAVPLAAAFRDERVHLVVGDRMPLVVQVLRRLLPSITTSWLQIFSHRPSCSLYPEYYDRVSAEIRHLMDHTDAEFTLMIQSGERLQENLWRNLPQMIGQAGVAQVENVLADVPAYVVAAGPSLNNNLVELSRVGESGVILCVDTSYRLLAQEGIVPHLVVATDPSELNERHFHGFSLGTEPILAFDPEVYYTIPMRLPWRRLVVNLDKCATTRWFEEHLGPWGYLEKGGSVANTAFSLARHMGCCPIVLVGLDLAYDPRGGATHAEGTALARPLEPMAAGASSVVMGRHQATEKPVVESLLWVPGALGGEVPTSRIMALYIRKFGEEVGRSDCHVIDATEGGALIHGTEILPLADTVSMFCSTEQMVHRRLSEAIGVREAIELDRVHSSVRAVARDLEEAARRARKGLEIVESLRPCPEVGARLRSDPRWIRMEETFSRIYEQPTVKAGVEQALFSAVYYFCQKEPEDAVEERLKKYRAFFERAAAMCDVFSRLVYGLFS